MRAVALVMASLAASIGVAAASPARLAPTVPHLVQVRSLYLSDHQGRAPQTDADLLPYSRQFEKLLASCTIGSADLTHAALFMAGEVRALGGPAFTNLMMLQAFARPITWSAPRDCWNGFIAAESRAEQAAAASQIQNRNPVTALYVYDHNGQSPKSDVDLLPYSRSLATILASCAIGRDDATNAMIYLSDKASQLGARTVTALAMMKAVVRRIDWQHRRVDCTAVFDDAEGHMETGGP